MTHIHRAVYIYIVTYLLYLKISHMLSYDVNAANDVFTSFALHIHHVDGYHLLPHISRKHNNVVFMSYTL